MTAEEERDDGHNHEGAAVLPIVGHAQLAARLLRVGTPFGHVPSGLIDGGQDSHAPDREK